MAQACHEARHGTSMTRGHGHEHDTGTSIARSQVLERGKKERNNRENAMGNLVVSIKLVRFIVWP